MDVRAVISSLFSSDPHASGGLGKAAMRLALTGRKYPRRESLSTWSLVCEEILDTVLRDEDYEASVCELYARGITPAELREMRAFAWATAGWLNYDKMLWDWCHLDEKDILLALDWQLKDGVISRAEYERGVAYLERYQRVLA
jgi:hypothetical protein